MVSELRRSRNLSLVPAFYPVHAGRADQFDLLQDILADWAEYEYLLNDLEMRWGALPPQFADMRASLQRSDYLAAKTQVRKCYRARALKDCADDWQSPIYAATTGQLSNRLMDGIAEHTLDYKRDGHLEALTYERTFVDEYVRHLGGANEWKAYLTNSGMSAFATALHWLVHEQHSGGSALAVEPMYFENLHLTQGFVSHVVRTKAASSADLLQSLRAENPSLVIMDAVTNCNEVVAHDIETVIQWASSERSERTCILIDTTCIPSALLRKDLFAAVPPHVTIVLVESLAKHHQFGMDAVTGGIAILLATAAQHADFGKTRARFGGNITDISARTLPTPNRHRLTTRMMRHSRNVSLLIEKLQDDIENYSGVIQSFSWLSEPPSYSAGFHGSCFNINLHENLRSIANYQHFEKQIQQLAKQRELPLAFSTSFGFDVTRLYVTAPSTAFEPPFLRVAIGTETVQEIKTLSEIIASVHRQLALLWKPRPALKSVCTQGGVRKSSPEPLKKAEALFEGADAIKNYLNPANYANTPMVELPSDLNPFAADRVRVFAKIMPLVPLMNIKSIPSFSMLNAAAERGELGKVRTVLESSSGNTVLSLSVMAKLFGINETRAIVDHSIAPSLLRMLRLFGIEVMKHPGPGHKLYASVAPRSERAREMGAQDGWLNPGQYSNPDNPEGFGRWLAPQLWSQTAGKIDVLSTALGTCGTIYGIGRELKSRKESLQIIGCCPASGQAVPGPRERAQLADVAFPWESVVDKTSEIEAKESFAASINLLRRGIMGGPSSGMNYVGLMQHLAVERATGRLGTGEKTAVFICCDSPLAHVDEYFEALSDEYFPAVHDYEGTER